MVQAKLSNGKISEDKLRGHPLAFHTKGSRRVGERQVLGHRVQRQIRARLIPRPPHLPLGLHAGQEATCVYGIDGKNAVVGTQRGWVYLLSLDDGVLQKKIQVDKKVHKKVAGGSDGSLLYVGCGTRSLSNKNHALEKKIELFTHIHAIGGVAQHIRSEAKDILQLSSNTDGVVLVVTPTALFK